MIAGRIQNTTRHLGAPAGWDHEKQGTCGQLAICDILTTAGPAMSSAWVPTPAELERLNAGAPVILTVIGTVHPPVAVGVGAPPTDSV